ncbi:MAG TPA: triacylglycerol lipase, partial [Polyangiaceae bacterium]|nr:triacylglycerol lipase [Polyangiaceae bacterium]
MRWLGVSAMLVAVGCGSESETPAALGAGGASASSATTSAMATSGAGGAEEKLGPPYPIVLAHGFFGFEDFAGLDFVNYFYGVKEHLSEHGEKLVFTPDVDPFNSSVHRGAQLAAEVQDILAVTGHEKVIL